MRIVLDTNVFISAIFWEGSSHDILKLAEENKITLAASQETLEELFGVLARNKFKHTSYQLKQILKRYQNIFFRW